VGADTGSRSWHQRHEASSRCATATLQDGAVSSFHILAQPLACSEISSER